MAGVCSNRIGHVTVGIVVFGVIAMTATEMLLMKRPPRDVQRDTLIVYISEMCYWQDMDVTQLEDVVANVTHDATDAGLVINLLKKEVICASSGADHNVAGQLSAVVNALAGDRTAGLVGSPAPAHCDTATRLAAMWGKWLVTWTCPTTKHIKGSPGTADVSGGALDGEPTRSDGDIDAAVHDDDFDADRLIPTLPAVATSFVVALRELRWKSFAIVTSDEGWWPSLAHSLDITFRREHGLVAKLFITIPQDATNHQRIVKLLPLNNIPCRVIIICASLHPVGQSILSTIDNMRVSQRFGTFIVIVDVISIIPYLQTSHSYSNNILSSSNSMNNSILSNVNTSNVSPSSSNNVQYSNNNNNSRSNANYHQNHSQNVTLSTLEKIFNADLSYLFKQHKIINFTQKFIEKLTPTLQKNILIYTATSEEHDVKELFSDYSTILKNSVLEHLKDGLKIIINRQKGIRTPNKYFQFALLDWYEYYDNITKNTISKWRPILRIFHNFTTKKAVFEKRINYKAEKLERNFDDWKWKHIQKDVADVCEDDNCLPLMPMKTAHVLIIVVCSSLFAIVVIALVAFTRNHYVKKRLEKGPYKILLTATDFVFPQVTDSRRVDEGIEAMLCCWLQQLQEFGGPEVDKPDLLKGSVGSLKSHAQGAVKGASSTGSLAVARTLLIDPRVRYNGDFVQLKELPSNQGTFELKSKAMDTLVMIHGLRHENLNPLIGCLTEPSRPALVFEWCTRGSLEDVLVMDEIKLDWSFRLSLLTDLVRAMRYLHSSPIRVHGYLTSRNCVIDARWVLKITDYGLPIFYEAQNITPSAKSARDLLWTAPELLRHIGLRKKGTQPADVYSFGIIMQEVVVRGEPFCMLALTPEEIIEKVKRPPPLIRPSVSKGAAPPEAINIMRQCWAEQAEMRPDFNAVYDLFKKLNHGRKVNFVDTMFQMLEKYSNNLEELIRERTEQLDMEKKKTEQLLNRMLPSSVAEKLKLGMPVDPEEFREVTIYFSDIVGFTTISAYSTPFQVVDLLNDLYTCFDATINAYSVYKVETIGDAYMVVGGLPVRIPDHAEQIATMALDLLHQSGRFKIRHLPRTPLRLRIGLHTGPCCAGVVGLTMPRYCLFGDTVNTASRMESTGSPWRIHLSQATKDKLEQAGGYHLEHRGPIEVKGKGCMHTYWLLGKDGFDKPLPTPPAIGLDEHLIQYNCLDTTRKSQNPSLNNCRSEDNSSNDCSSSFGVPADRLSPCPTTTDHKTSESTSTSTKTTVKVSASVHDEKNINDYPRMSFSSSDTSKISTFNSQKVGNEQQQQQYDDHITPEYSLQSTVNNVIKSTSSDTPMSLGTPISSSEVAAALLGASTSSLSNQSGLRNPVRHRKVGVIDEDDLSTPYNHYRCLSPNDGKLTSSTERNPARFLKRQFSLDRGDDSNNPDLQIRTAPRLSKQNSAGAAPDLERIEEIPVTPATISSPYHHYRHRSEMTTPYPASLSVSVDSLSLHQH